MRSDAMSARTFNLLVKEEFFTSVTVSASSLEEAKEKVRGHVGSTRSLSSILDETACVIRDAPIHPSSVRIVRES